MQKKVLMPSTIIIIIFNLIYKDSQALSTPIKHCLSIRAGSCLANHSIFFLSATESCLCFNIHNDLSTIQIVASYVHYYIQKVVQKFTAFLTNSGP